MVNASSPLPTDQTGNVLVVDDEEKNRELLQDLLEANGYSVTTACDGVEALEKINGQERIDTILLDIMMPKMDGFEVCQKIKSSPETAHIPVLLVTSLTEREDRLKGIEAGANDFISKPIDTKDVLLRTHNAVYTAQLFQEVQREYERISRLEAAEKKLLEQTLHGSVKVLTEILEITNPETFKRATRVKRYVRNIAKSLDLTDIWELELAAMFSQIGTIAVPPDVMEKVYRGDVLSKNEEKMFRNHPELGSKFIGGIPRLEGIAGIIGAQQLVFHRSNEEEKYSEEDRVSLGGHILKIALEFDRLISRELPINTITRRLQQLTGNETPQIIAALENLKVEEEKVSVETVRVADLEPAMIFHEDIYSTDGKLLINKGQEANLPAIARLRNYSRGIGVKQPFRVIVKTGLIGRE